ncbi:MAG: RNA polymerase sigma factor [Candidatus Cyclobacteriaceae bacterium M3_2C_046]
MRLRIHKSKTEEDLIRDCQKQDGKAQKAIYDKYSSGMLGLCTRYIKDKMEAEDVMIAGFLKVFDKINQYQGQGSFEGWIKRIMINESLQYLRKHKNMYLEVDIEQANRTPDFQLLHNHLEVEDLMKMVNGLPMGYRTVFNLYAIEGYSHKEIAATLDISENTSKSQLSRARSILQKSLIENENKIQKKLLGNEKS